MYKILLIITALFFVSGCATLTGGTSQSVTVRTIEENGEHLEGAKCVVDYKFHIVTPQVIVIDKKADGMMIKCDKEGYKQGANVASANNLEAWTWGNLLFGGIIGVGVDYFSGAMYDYDDVIDVTMHKDDGND